MKITVAQQIERIHVEGPMEEKQEIIDYCYNNGYHHTRSGPKLIGWHEVNPDVYEMIAEKVISEKKIDN